MQKPNLTVEKLVITYARKKTTKKPRQFHLSIDHVAGNPINFTLFAEKCHNKQWRPLSIEIDIEETLADLSQAYTSLADLRWYIFNRKERSRVLTPIVGLWEEDGLCITACLSDRYGGMRLPLAKQEAWFLGDKGKNPPHFNGEMNCPSYDVNGAINIAKKYLETLNEQPVVVLGTPKMYRFDGCSFVA